MEVGSIEREVFIEASPEIVFEVVSSPEHLKRWWPDEARYEPTPGSAGELVFGDRAAGGKVVSFAVLEVRPPRLFSFRWTHPAQEQPAADNSLLVTFDLTPADGGTLLRMTETGFRERGWAVALAQREYASHVTGWDLYLPRLAPYVASLGVPR